MVVPFLVHQVLDYLAGLYLLQAGSKLHGRAATVCYIAGAVVLLAATLSGRPLGGGPISAPCTGSSTSPSSLRSSRRPSCSA